MVFTVLCIYCILYLLYFVFTVVCIYCICIFCHSDMENVMSVPSTSCVKYQSLGKFLALNIRCFDTNVLSVAIPRCFKLKLVGNVRVYWKTGSKKSQKNSILDIMLYQRRKRSLMLMKMCFIWLNINVPLFCCFFGFDAIFALLGKSFDWHILLV